MEALDTNVLTRYVVGDGGDHAPKAELLIERAAAGGNPYYVDDFVVAELAWVLGSTYGFGRGRLADILDELLVQRGLMFDSARRLERALDRFRSGPAGFVDYLLLERALDKGADRLRSFDQAFARSDEVVAP